MLQSRTSSFWLSKQKCADMNTTRQYSAILDQDVCTARWNYLTTARIWQMTFIITCKSVCRRHQRPTHQRFFDLFSSEVPLEFVTMNMLILLQNTEIGIKIIVLTTGRISKLKNAMATKRRQRQMWQKLIWRTESSCVASLAIYWQITAHNLEKTYSTKRGWRWKQDQ